MKMCKSNAMVAIGAVAFAAMQGLTADAGFAASAEAPPSMAGSDVVATNSDVVISAGKSTLIELPAAYSDLMIAAPTIADVVPVNTRSIYVVGKSIGSTALTIYGQGKRLLMTVNVTVSADIEGLKARLHEILPEENDISVRAANQSILLSGTVKSPAALQQVLTLAETYSPGKVVNVMSVQGTQQVMLSVRFVEMERKTAKDLRLNVQQTATGSDPQVFLQTGDTIVNTAQTVLNTFGSAALAFSSGGGDLTFLFDALETKGMVKTLAEPTLVTMSGDTANFLAGGEFPIPVASFGGGGAGSSPIITVEFKAFGISLAFTPTVIKDGLINLVVNPEVSSIDPTTSVNLGTVSVPGIKVRRAHTTVELRDGESFTIAGLLSDSYQNEVRQFPFLGDIPILGALFRSTGYQHDQTELVMVVTPRLVVPRRAVAATPADQFVPPSDLELFLFGAQRGTAANLSTEDRALLSADPSKGGVDGPYGHVLY